MTVGSTASGWLGASALAAGLLIVACSRSGGAGAREGGAAEPDKAVRAFAAATSRGDVPAMRRIMVSPARIKRALTCPGGESLVHDVEHAFTALDGLAKLDRDELRQLDVAIEGVEERGRVVVARGGSFHGCTAREGFEARTYLVHSGVHIGPIGDTGDEAEEVVLLDGVWWLLPAQ